MTKSFQDGFFHTPEYQRIASIGTRFQDLLSPGAYVERGDEKHEVTTVPEAVEWLMTRAKQGQTIQRYKGLGEMNPEQLWRDTMDPASRTVLRVETAALVGAAICAVASNPTSHI